jgi:hypothetical protein
MTVAGAGISPRFARAAATVMALDICADAMRKLLAHASESARVIDRGIP